MDTPAKRDVLANASVNAVAIGVLAIAAALYLPLALFPSVFYAPLDPRSYLGLHTLVELFSVTVCFSTFGVSWHSFTASRNPRALFLSAALLTVGALDFAHAMSHPGMPDFLTPTSAQKTIVLWLEARAVCAAAFLASAYIDGETRGWWMKRPVLLTCALALTAAGLVFGVGYPDRLPTLLLQGTGPTPLKIHAEEVVVATLGLAYASYWRRLSRTGDRRLLLYLVAFAGCGISELTLTLYRTGMDTYALAGHLFKAVAFVFVFRAGVSLSVRAPYMELLAAAERLRAEVAQRQRTEEALRSTERQLETLVESFPDLISRFDRERRHTYVSPAVERFFGVRAADILGKTLRELGPPGRSGTPAEIGAMESGIDAAFEQGVPNERTAAWESAGGERVFEIRHVPERDEAGRVASVLGIARDVTEKRRTEERVALLDYALDRVHEAAFLIDEQGRFLFVNEEACRALGESREELEGSTVFAVDPDFPPDGWALHWAQLRAQQRLTFESRHRRKDGRVFPVEITASYVEHRGRAYNLALVRDISERKRVASVLQARLRLLEFAVGHSVDEFLTAALDELEALTGSTIGFYHFLESDQETLWLRTWSTNTLRRMCTAEGRDSHYPVSQAGVWADCVRERSAIVHNDYASVPHRKGMPAGHAPVTREVVVPVFRGGQIKAVIGVGNKASDYDDTDVTVVSQLGDLSWDIAERKRAEAALTDEHSTLRGIIDSAPVLIFSVDARYRYTSFNQGHAAAMRALYGAEIEPGRGILDYMAVPEDRETARRNLDRALSGEQLVEEAFSGEGVQRQYFRVSHSPIRTDQQAIIGVAVLAQDMTERRKAEERVRELNQELERRVSERTAELAAANRELEAFAYSVSHDLRAPLRHVDAFVELLAKQTGDALDERSRHYMETISSAARRMGGLIDDLLSFSRMGRTEMSRQQVDLMALVEDVIGEFDLDLRGRTVRWTVARLPTVTGDRAMLRVVLVNLISNAVKFTKPRPLAEVEVGTVASPDHRETVIFVRDNGVGFDPAYAAQLFGVFQRLHHEEDFAGTGIGLANVRQIVSRHGGRTWAEGQVGHGATFYFSLP